MIPSHEAELDLRSDRVLDAESLPYRIPLHL